MLYYVRQNQEVALSLLIDKYHSMIEAIARRITRKYYFNMTYIDELVQLGLIAFVKAIDDYREDKGRSFRGYAHMCVECDIKSAMRSLLTNKQKSLSTSHSLDAPLHDDLIFQDVFEEKRAYFNPQETLMVKELMSEMVDYAKMNLSQLEMDVLVLKLQGYDYTEIAEQLDKPCKVVDNALFRAKSKLVHYKKLTSWG